MQTQQIDIQTADGAMDCFIARPDGDGPFMPVLFYMDVPGIRQELRDMAMRVASDGFLCVLPDLYYRSGKVRFDLRKGESELKKMFAEGSKLTNQMIVSDTAAMLAHLDADPHAMATTGTVGYCMSGQFVISVAGSFPDRVLATAALYGTRMVTDAADSPHLLIPQINGEVFLGFADHDPYVDDDVIPTMETAFTANTNVLLDLVRYPDTEHGFCFPQRPGYREGPAEDAWTRMIEMYRRASASS